MSEENLRFSIVSAAYNVEKYLDEFIGSVESQQFSLDRVEVIVVDDGSTDGTLARLQAWQRSKPGLVTVLTKPNGGQSSARNLGMEYARGEWITFPDPDDILEVDYLAEVDTFLRQRPSTMLVAAKRILFNDLTGARTPHPLQAHFTTKNRLRNLNLDTGHFHGSAPCAFFRLELLREMGLRFDDRVKPTFEDGHFCCRYLLRVEAPLVAYVQSAVYLYRKRSEANSTLDLAWMDPRKYVDVPEYGFRDLLREGIEICGTAPAWLQSMVIYELSWYFRVEDRVPWVSICARGNTADRFYELMCEIVKLLDAEMIENYPARQLRRLYREMFVHSFQPNAWHTPYAIIDKIDMKQRLLRLSYRYVGAPPSAMFDVDGAEVTPVYDKVRALRYFDRDLMHERIVWLPFGTVRVLLNNADVDVRTGEPPQKAIRMDSWVLRKRFDPVVRKQTTRVPRRPRRSDLAIRRLARSRPVRRYFRNAWVLMDRVYNADDSAEHLFRYLRKHRRRINSWFVIESQTPDWRRLRRSHPWRVVAYGSMRWKLLLLNAQHVISSHIDVEIVRPVALARLEQPRWRYTFLQHGVIKDDISRWLNQKDVDLFVTSTPAERESIIGDKSPYRFTGREVKLTGLPRFDRLREQGATYGPSRRDLLLVAPTWRSWLMGERVLGQHRKPEDMKRLLASEFVTEWGRFVSSEGLRRLADASGVAVSLLLHPNLQSISADLNLPPHIQLLKFEGEDVQAIFARARVFVTDYSSMAFNAAYIERPIVYFQFDAERFFGGGHIGRKGYFDFERDGFGPVTMTAGEAVEAVATALEHGPEPQLTYLRRIEATFPLRDGRCCERVVDAIRDSVKRVPRDRWAVTPEQRPIDAIGTVPLELRDIASGKISIRGGESAALEANGELIAPHLFANE